MLAKRFNLLFTIWMVLFPFCVHRNNAIGQETIKHSYLVLGGKTAIISEGGDVAWEYDGGSRDGFVLPSGNLLLAYSNREIGRAHV